MVVVAIVLAVLIPLFWMVSASLKTQNEVYDFAWLPRVPQWHNYLVGLTTYQFGRYFLNTILVTGINVIAGGLVASWTAFALARLDFPGRNLIFAVVLGTMMVPFAAYMIPSFVLFRWLGWIDTYTDDEDHRHRHHQVVLRRLLGGLAEQRQADADGAHLLAVDEQHRPDQILPVGQKDVDAHGGKRRTRQRQQQVPVDLEERCSRPSWPSRPARAECPCSTGASGIRRSRARRERTAP